MRYALLVCGDEAAPLNEQEQRERLEAFMGVAVGLVFDLRLPVPLQCIECGSHGVELLGRMTDPVDKLANDA